MVWTTFFVRCIAGVFYHLFCISNLFTWFGINFRWQERINKSLCLFLFNCLVRSWVFDIQYKVLANHCLLRFDRLIHLWLQATTWLGVIWGWFFYRVFIILVLLLITIIHWVKDLVEIGTSLSIHVLLGHFIESFVHYVQVRVFKRARLFIFLSCLVNLIDYYSFLRS